MLLLRRVEEVALLESRRHRRRVLRVVVVDERGRLRSCVGEGAVVQARLVHEEALGPLVAHDAVVRVVDGLGGPPLEKRLLGVELSGVDGHRDALCAANEGRAVPVLADGQYLHGGGERSRAGEVEGADTRLVAVHGDVFSGQILVRVCRGSAPQARRHSVRSWVQRPRDVLAVEAAGHHGRVEAGCEGQHQLVAEAGTPQRQRLAVLSSGYHLVEDDIGGLCKGGRGAVLLEEGGGATGELQGVWGSQARGSVVDGA